MTADEPTPAAPAVDPAAPTPIALTFEGRVPDDFADRVASRTWLPQMARSPGTWVIGVALIAGLVAAIVATVAQFDALFASGVRISSVSPARFIPTQGLLPLVMGIALVWVLLGRRRLIRNKFLALFPPGAAVFSGAGRQCFRVVCRDVDLRFSFAEFDRIEHRPSTVVLRNRFTKERFSLPDTALSADTWERLLATAAR